MLPDQALKHLIPWHPESELTHIADSHRLARLPPPEHRSCSTSRTFEETRGQDNQAGNDFPFGDRRMNSKNRS